MTAQELRDIFYNRYLLEAKKRNIREITLNEKYIAYLMSEAQQDVVRKIPFLESSTTISVISGTYEYDLPVGCGDIKKVVIDNAALDRVTLDELQGVEKSELTPTEYAMKPGNPPKIMFGNAKSGTATVYYYIDTNFYSPSSSDSQDWGGFDGASYTGDLVLPDRYLKAVQYYMLSEIFPGYWDKYIYELNGLKESQASNKTSFNYRINGGI